MTHQTEVIVRFNEADPLGIVWHGHYLRYFEDGREAFGRQHGLSYRDFYDRGIAVPIVSVHCDYARPLRYGDTATIETTYVPTSAAKLQFDYRIIERASGGVVATGTTVQVFVDAKTFELQLTVPPLVEDWKRKYHFV